MLTPRAMPRGHWVSEGLTLEVNGGTQLTVMQAMLASPYTDGPNQLSVPTL